MRSELPFGRLITRKSLFPLALLAVSLCYLLLRNEIPQWRAGGTAAVLHEPLAPVGSFPVQLAAGASVLCIGDSNTRGRFGPSGGLAYPEVLAQALGKGVTVVNNGRGGAVVADWTAAIPTEDGPGDLVVLSFGTNDAAPRGWWSSRQAVPVGTYQASLEALAGRYRQRGAHVLILAPLPTGTKAMDLRISPYRLAARQAALATGSRFLDPAQALLPAKDIQPPLRSDALHLNASGSRQVGRWLADKVQAFTP